jgi:hypothetical protein
MTVTVNLLAVLLAVVVAFVANFVWFGPKTFYPVWARALGKDPAEAPGQEGGLGMGAVFGLTILGSVVMALTVCWVLQAAMSVYDITDASPGFGAVTGATVGVGIAAAASLGHRLFAGQGLTVWAIEIGGDILGLTLMGLVLAFFY